MDEIAAKKRIDQATDFASQLYSAELMIDPATTRISDKTGDHKTLNNQIANALSSFRNAESLNNQLIASETILELRDHLVSIGLLHLGRGLIRRSKDLENENYQLKEKIKRMDKVIKEQNKTLEGAGLPISYETEEGDVEKDE